MRSPNAFHYEMRHNMKGDSKMLLGNLETSKQTVSPERTAEQKSVWDPDEISRLQESLNEMIREWERQNKLQFLTRFKGIPIYVDPQTGKTFVRARDIGCLANLTPRKTRKWAAQAAKHINDVSKYRVPDSAGTRQMTIMLGWEAALRLNDYGAPSPLVTAIGIYMGSYERGFADGQASVEK